MKKKGKKFVTIKGIDEIIKQDDLAGFINFTNTLNLSFKETLLATNKLSYKVRDLELPLIVSIVYHDALKIFTAIEKEVPGLYNQEFMSQDNKLHPIIYHALKAVNTKLLKYLIEEEKCELFFKETLVSKDTEFSIIHNLIYQLHIEFMLLNNKTKISNNDLKETEKYISLYLDKLDLILGILKDKDKEFLSFIFHHGNNDSILVLALQTPKPNKAKKSLGNFQEKLLVKLIDWMLKNNQLDFFTKSELFSFWGLENKTINKLIEAAKNEFKIDVKLEKIDVINTEDLKSNSLNNPKNVDSFLKNSKTSQKVLSVNEKYHPYKWEDVEKDFKYSSFFEKNRYVIDDIVMKEKGDFNELFNITKTLVEYDCLNGYYAHQTEGIKQSIHIKALIHKKYEALKVILKAVNGIEYEMKKDLIELISLSKDNLLSDYFVKNLNSHAINTQNDEGNTLLHFAVMHNNLHLINRILQKNPNLSIKNNENKTALDIASSFEDKNIFELLKYFELKKINEPNNTNQTFALKEDKFEINEKQEKAKTTKGQKKFELAYRLENEGRGFEKITARWDFEEIEGYKKFKLSLNDKVDSIKEAKEFSWFVDGKEYKSSDKNIFCHKYYNKDYYMMIDEALNTSKFTQKFEVFKKILEDQGFAKSEKGFNGVITHKKVWKIKDVEEGDRLYSTKFYTHETHTETLIIYDKVDSHEKIQEIRNSGCHMEEEVCKNPEVLIIEENHSESFQNDPIEPLGNQFPEDN